MFGSFGIEELVVLAGTGVFLAFVVISLTGSATSKRATGSVLVLRKFRVDELSPDGVVVEIVGRPSGVIAWLLTVLGLEAETCLSVSEHDVSFKQSSLSGRSHALVPLTQISSTQCGYSKPIGYLILGSLVLLGSLYLGAQERDAEVSLFGLIIWGAFLLAYWVRKRMMISIETSGGTKLGLRFQRSVIENVPVDIQRVIQTIEVINNKILQSRQTVAVRANAADGATGTGVSQPSFPATRQCPNCGAKVSPSGAFCGSCGASVT